MHPDRPESYLNLAKFYKKTDRDKLSEEYLRKSEELLLTYYYPRNATPIPENLKRSFKQGVFNLWLFNIPYAKWAPCRLCWNPMKALSLWIMKKYSRMPLKKTARGSISPTCLPLISVIVPARGTGC